MVFFDIGKQALKQTRPSVLPNKASAALPDVASYADIARFVPKFLQ